MGSKIDLHTISTKLTADKAMAYLVKNHEPKEIADFLQVHNVHIYNYINLGKISPTVHRSLEAVELIPPKKKRYRLHYECGYGEEGASVAAWIRRMMEREGIEGFTDFVDYLIFRD